jgi:DNA-binding CsgD family transcriptional regulator
MARRSAQGVIARLVARSFDSITGVGASHPRTYAATLVVAGVGVGAVEIHLADFEHGTHLLLLLALTIAIAVLRGPGPAALGLLVGGGGAGATSFGTVEPANHPDTVVQLTMYLVAGVAFILVVWLAAEGQRRRAATSAAVIPVVPPGTSGPVEHLTGREREVLRLAASGISVDEIAHALFVSPNTVKTHLTHAYAKLGARGRSDAVRSAIHLQYLTVDDICPHLRQDTDADSSKDR